MTLWTGQRVGVEPDTAPPHHTLRPCSRCCRPTRVQVSRMWYPVTCWRCSLRAEVAELGMRLLCAAGSALFVIVWVWLFFYLGGAR
jgi:hypothetical protein